MAGRLELVTGVVVLATVGLWPGPQGSALRPKRDPQLREFKVVAKRYAFSPSRLEVDHGDIVRITLTTEDIPHTLTIDRFRVSKRATRDRAATIEFVADTPGTYVFYCSLTTENGCRTMRGELVVR